MDLRALFPPHPLMHQGWGVTCESESDTSLSSSYSHPKQMIYVEETELLKYLLFLPGRGVARMRRGGLCVEGLLSTGGDTPPPPSSHLDFHELNEGLWSALL